MLDICVNKLLKGLCIFFRILDSHTKYRFVNHLCLQNIRVPEAEPYIMKDFNASLYYVRYVIKDRWPELESYINNDPSVFNKYWYWYSYFLEELKSF